MQALTRSYRGVTLVMNLNWDRILYTATLIGALYAGSYVALI